MAVLVEIGFRSGLAGSQVHTQPGLPFLLLSPFYLAPLSPHPDYIFFFLYNYLWPLLLSSDYHSVWNWTSHFIFLNHLTSRSLRLPVCPIGIITVSSSWERLGGLSEVMDKVLYKSCLLWRFLSASLSCAALTFLFFFLPLFHLLPQRRGLSFLRPLSHWSQRGLKPPGTNKALLPLAIPAWRHSQLLPAHLQLTASPMAHFLTWEKGQLQKCLLIADVWWRRRQLLAHYPQAVET